MLRMRTLLGRVYRAACPREYYLLLVDIEVHVNRSGRALSNDYITYIDKAHPAPALTGKGYFPR